MHANIVAAVYTYIAAAVYAAYMYACTYIHTYILRRIVCVNCGFVCVKCRFVYIRCGFVCVHCVLLCVSCGLWLWLLLSVRMCM